MKFTNKIQALIIIILSLMVLSSCSNIATGQEKQTSEENEIPLDELEFKLEEPSEKLQTRFVNEYVAYRNYDPEDHPTVAIESWYGSFGNIHFLLVFDGQIAYSQAHWTDNVAESSFAYADGQSILVWVNKQFLTIKQAYEQDLITVDMIKTIENIHNGSEGHPIQMLKD